jgi:hypothetical protein
VAGVATQPLQPPASGPLTHTQLCGAHTRARTPLWQDAARAQDDAKKVWVGPAIAVLVQCICLFVGGLIFRIVRRKEEHAI